MQRLALHDPCGCKDGIREKQESDRPLESSPKGFDARYAHKEEADRDFSPHQRRKGLNPFSVSIFAELENLMWREELLVTPKAIRGFHKVETGTDGIANLVGTISMLCLYRAR